MNLRCVRVQLFRRPPVRIPHPFHALEMMALKALFPSMGI
jgi:hypothetical protein